MRREELEKILEIANSMIDTNSEIMCITPEKIKSLIITIKELEAEINGLRGTQTQK